MDMLIFPLALTAGASLALQAGANAQLAKAVGSPVLATAIQLSVGAIILIAATFATGTAGAVARVGQAEWWHAVGGVASAFYVMSTILLFPRLGAVVTIGLSIAGQMLASFCLDGFGLLGLPVEGIRLGAAMGTLVVVAGTGLVVAGQSGGDRRSSAQLGWIVLALAAGAVLPVQGAVNALLRHDLGGAPFAVGAISFVVATSTMLAVFAALSQTSRAPKTSISGVKIMPWWGWLGGITGAFYVTTVFSAIPAIGAGTTIGLTVAGQQLASMLVDQNGWLRLPRRPVSATRLAGIALLFIGTVFIKA